MYIRKMGNKWQGQVRLNNHPLISKCFVSRMDAKRWAVATETKLRRDDAIANSLFDLI